MRLNLVPIVQENNQQQYEQFEQLQTIAKDMTKSEIQSRLNKWIQSSIYFHLLNYSITVE